MRYAPVHQYIQREDRAVKTERLIGDRLVRFLYAPAREDSSWFYRILASPQISEFLAFWNFDLACNVRLQGLNRFIRNLRIDLSEAVDPPEALDTIRKVFERKIRYWDKRPMGPDLSSVAAPADSKMLLGSLQNTSLLFLKGKFFDLEELLGRERQEWEKVFRRGDFAVFRLTPEKYHYNHAPVSGIVLDLYGLPGTYHSCNPAAVISVATPFSKNKRVITVIDTDVDGGSGVGRVAMVEIAALMIGDIVQVYSEREYESPRAVTPGLFLKKGQPKSLFRPGSSTVVLIFERGRVRFLPDLVSNQQQTDVQSRFTRRWGIPLAETDVRVRSTIAARVARLRS
jgi:phosphatidylserine decarboxylase